MLCGRYLALRAPSARLGRQLQLSESRCGAVIERMTQRGETQILTGRMS
jgi:hypothetical protein